MTTRYGTYGKIYNRAGRGFTGGTLGSSDPSRVFGAKPPAPMQEWKLLLHKLGYNLKHPKVVAHFKRDYNDMIECGMLHAAPFKGKTNYAELEAGMRRAVKFDNKMPKTWVYYVKKCHAMMGTQ